MTNFVTQFIYVKLVAFFFFCLGKAFVKGYICYEVLDYGICRGFKLEKGFLSLVVGVGAILEGVETVHSVW
jgi:hypothetical protein